MNYTENYHLPQWEEQDRVMRTDFNQMCAGMEEGLVENQRGTQKGLALAEDRTFGRFCRAAYNHYCYIRELESVPRQIGVFHQGFDKSFAGVSGLAQRDHYAWMTTGEAPFTSDDFKRGLRQVSKMNVVKDDPAACTPEVLTFRATAPGKISQIGFTGKIRNGDGTPIIWRYSLYNTETGALEARQDVTVSSSSNTTGGFLPSVSIYFLSGYDYRLEISPYTTNYNGEFEFSMDTSHVATLCYMLPEGSVTHVFQESEGSSGGLAVVRYNIKENTAAIRLEWDGEEVAPDRIRTVTENGVAMQEAEYRHNKPIPAESRLVLHTTCEINGELSLYSWGAVLL